MNKIFYSPELAAFYLEGVHPYIPGDVFEVDKEEYAALQAAVGDGKRIVYKGRKLKLETQVIPPITWDQIRERRDTLLTKCDWTQLSDNALTDEQKTAWAGYRQALRDITTKYKDPTRVVWPINPNTKE